LAVICDDTPGLRAAVRRLLIASGFAELLPLMAAHDACLSSWQCR
jgi:hypothetical protein